MNDHELRAQIAEFYSRLGLHPDAWHIGPEHPALEQLGIAISERLAQNRVLELGVQSGGFTIPVALATHGRPGFSYTGVDSLEYTNAIPLRHVEAFLRQSGVTTSVRFFESDSTPVLRRAPAGAFDLILMDHYKPKYPLDLYVIFSRSLLSADGRIILHDVLAHAAPEWEVCKRICQAFGYGWTLHPEVPQGAAVVARQGGQRPDGMLAAAVYLRWYRHAAVLKTRRTAGKFLRALGLRH
jgi:predicted O-methyltransferase YrrM